MVERHREHRGNHRRQGLPRPGRTARRHEDFGTCWVLSGNCCWTLEPCRRADAVQTHVTVHLGRAARLPQGRLCTTARDKSLGLVSEKVPHYGRLRVYGHPLEHGSHSIAHRWRSVLYPGWIDHQLFEDCGLAGTVRTLRPCVDFSDRYRHRDQAVSHEVAHLARRCTDQTSPLV